jgi:hypothetical protein
VVIGLENTNVVIKPNVTERGLEHDVMYVGSQFMDEGIEGRVTIRRNARSIEIGVVEAVTSTRVVDKGGASAQVRQVLLVIKVDRLRNTNLATRNKDGGVHPFIHKSKVSGQDRSGGR